MRTSDAGEQVVLRVDTLDPAAWGLILVDIAKHVAHACARQGKCTANEAFAQVLQGLIAALGHAARGEERVAARMNRTREANRFLEALERRDAGVG